MQEDRINNNAAASPVEVWDGWAQGSEPRGVQAGMAQPLSRGFRGRRAGLIMFIAVLAMGGFGRLGVAATADVAATNTSGDGDQHAPPSAAGHNSAAEPIPTLARIWTTNLVTISGLCHALIFYGRGSTDLPGFASGDKIIQVLTDEDTALRTFGKNPFVRTRHGLRYYLANDPLNVTAFGEVHRDQCLATLAAMDLPLTTPIHLKSKTYSLADLVAESVANYSFEQREMAWTAIAYARYLPPKKEWVNRFGERTSFSQLAQYLLTRDHHLESCAGTHLFQALARLDQADRAHAILDGETRQRLDTYLRTAIQEAVQRQQADGSWNKTWCHLITNEDTAPLTPFACRMLVTGHLFEVLNPLDAQRRPPSVVCQRAADWLSQSLNSPEIRPGGTWICPFTHAARAARFVREQPLHAQENGNFANAFHPTGSGVDTQDSTTKINK